MPPQDLEQLKINSAAMRFELDLMQGQIEKLVTQLEFGPIKLIVYGMVSMIIAGAFGAILSKVFVK